jgi:hypothetical protein
MLADYLDAMLEHRNIVVWVDGDKAVSSHPLVGSRLRATHHAMRQAIRGDRRSSVSRVLSASALGVIWRPLRNLTDVDLENQKAALLDAVMSVAGRAREAG